MLHSLWKYALCLALLLPVGISRGEEASSEPNPIPKTRAEEKQALEALKHRKPRLPLPEPTLEEKERASQGGGGTSGFGLVNNGRMRSLYLPEDLRPRSNNQQRTAGTSRAGQRPSDPNMTLNYPFTVELFWIASRANNCFY